METFSALLAICAGNLPVPGEFPALRPVTRNFDVFFDLRPNKLLNKQSWGWWFETPLRPLWRHRNGLYHGWRLSGDARRHSIGSQGIDLIVSKRSGLSTKKVRNRKQTRMPSLIKSQIRTIPQNGNVVILMKSPIQCRRGSVTKYQTYAMRLEPVVGDLVLNAHIIVYCGSVELYNSI